MGDEFVATIYRNMESGQSCKITNMTIAKGSERRPFIFVFIFQMKLSGKLRNGNKKVQATMSMDLVEFNWVR